MHIPTRRPSSDKHSSSTENDGKKFSTAKNVKDLNGKRDEEKKYKYLILLC